MNNYVQMTQRNIPSIMDLIQLHAQLNDELEKFSRLLVETKKIPIDKLHPIKDEQQTIFQTIENINKNIRSKAMTLKSDILLH